MAIRFEYDPLPSTGVHIRLLKYQHDQDTELMVFRLTTNELPMNDQTSLDYFALSYTWGDDEPSHTIIVNGSPFTIAQNLYDFLLQRRFSRDSAVALWVDAICIDQDDLEERASQVRYMQQIYRGATKVIAWLGPGTRTSDIAMDTISRHLDLVELRIPSDRMSSVQLEAIRAWACQPYWSRCWVVQEFLLARTLDIKCGRQTMSWKSMRDLVPGSVPRRRIEWRLNFVQDVWDTIDSTPAASLLLQRARLWAHSRKPSLYTLVIDNSSRGCRVVHDRIFAMLGLADRHTTRAVHVSYTWSIPSLLVDIIDGMRLEWRNDIIDGMRHELRNDRNCNMYEQIGTLTRLFNLYAADIVNECEKSHSLSKPLRVHAYHVGQITYNRVIHRQDSLEPAKPEFVGLDLTRDFESEPYLRENFSRVLAVDSSSLILPQRLSPGAIMAGSASSQVSESREQRTSAVTVKLASHTATFDSSNPLLPGIAFGHVKEGDQVAYFPKIHGALVLDEQAWKEGRTELTGRLLLPENRHSSGIPGVDYPGFLTHDRFRTANPPRIHLALDPMDMLLLACSPRTRA
jgi:hypothetical protein